MAILQTNPPPTVRLFNQLVEAREGLEEILTELDDNYNEIALIDPANVLTYMTRCDEQHERCAKDLQDLTDCAMQIEIGLRKEGLTTEGKSFSGDGSAATPPTTDGTTTDGDVVRYRPNVALKPETLTKDAAPAEFRAFMKNFMGYYRTSNMNLLAQSDQLLYLGYSLEPTLLELIEPHFTPNTQIQAKANESVLDPTAAATAPFDPEPSAFQLLYDCFAKKFPVVTRRFNLFKMRPHFPSQLFTEWTRKLHKSGDECDVNLMREDDIYVMLYLAAVQGHPKLSEELHKVQNPTTAKLFAAAEAFEIAQNQRKLIDSPKAMSSTTSKTGHKGKQNKQSSSSSSSVRNPQPTQPTNSFVRNTQASPSSSGFKCFRCGNKDKAHTCNALNAVCKFCNKTGHFKGVCNARAKAEQSGGAKSKAQAHTSTVQAKTVTVAQAGTD